MTALSEARLLFFNLSSSVACTTATVAIAAFSLLLLYFDD